ncbi:MAG: TPR repeat-containing protein [Gammaproteobacteria bacterium]|nr:TPR repeat-containing protein [Gammaproteobacteria bacterium]
MSEIENLESILARGQDHALLRFALGNAFMKFKKYAQATDHLAKAVEYDPGYSAAWKLYGIAMVETDQLETAASIFEQGIAAAESKGDMQAVREMRVLLKRLRRNSPGSE